MQETECPECGAMNNIEEVEDYEIVKCYGCGKEFEKIGNDLYPL